MTASEWPRYSTGPRDSIFAVGLIAAKFTELESILHLLFVSTFFLRGDSAMPLIGRLGAETIADLIKQKLKDGVFPNGYEWRAEYINHFLAGFAVCAHNRNHLLHSSMAWTSPAPANVFFKTSRQGRTVVATPSLEELRTVADEMHAYTSYGRMIVNAFNNSLANPPIIPESAFPFPDKPPVPIKLDFTTDIRALSSPPVENEEDPFTG